MNHTSIDNKIGLLNLIVVILTIYVLGALITETVFTLSTETSRLLNLIDEVICIFFLLEFSYRFIVAENKLSFMRWGWIDLIASIPTVGILRIGRIFRLLRLFRVIRAFKSTHNLLNFLFANKSKGALTSVTLIAVLLVIFSAIAILQVETDPNSNIKTAEDAIWWAYVTITTVGYGDKFPVTTEGRIIASVLMTAGVGLFGTFTAYVASWFVADKENNKD